MYTKAEMELAEELAKSLEDEASFPFYLACTKKYSHRVLRDRLNHVLGIPDSGITHSRAALFTHIISRTPKR